MNNVLVCASDVPACSVPQKTVASRSSSKWFGYTFTEFTALPSHH